MSKKQAKEQDKKKAKEPAKKPGRRKEKALPATVDSTPASSIEKAKKTNIEFVASPPSELVPYDENLLERSRIQWQFGDWESLSKLERDTLQHHPDRAKLALLAAAGHQQLGNMAAARQFTRLAQDWGCSKKLVSQILIAGVHNTLGRAAASTGKEVNALKHFEAAIATGIPGSDTRLLVQARLGEQVRQLALSTCNNNSIYAELGIERPRAEEQNNVPVVPFKLEDCKKHQSQPRESIIQIGNRTAISKEITYGGKKFDFFYRPDSIGDNGAIRQTFEEKQYEFGWLPQGKLIYQLFKETLEKGKTPVIIDAGANIGTSCLWFNLKFPEATIIAVEPDADNCELLKNNSAGLNVLLFKGGLADSSRTLYLNDPGQSDWGFRVETSGKLKVNCIGPLELINYCTSKDHAPIIMKIDIEGGESLVFNGQCQWLKSIPLLIIELHDWMLPGQNSSKNFLKAITNYDFDIITRGENIMCFNRKILGSGGHL